MSLNITAAISFAEHIILIPSFSDIELRALVLIAAILIDRMVGEPAFLWRHLPHPVVIFGKLISFCEQYLYLASIELIPKLTSPEPTKDASPQHHTPPKEQNDESHAPSRCSLQGQPLFSDLAGLDGGALRWSLIRLGSLLALSQPSCLPISTWTCSFGLPFRL